MATVPGTFGGDVFVPTSNDNYYGGGGNDIYVISPYTLRSGATAKIIDTEGDNLIQLVDGTTVTSSSFYADAAQLELSTGARVQILGASKLKYQVGANSLAGDTETVLTYSDFATNMGASLSGTLPASGTAGYVVPTGFTQASAPAPAVAGNPSTVTGTLEDDVLVPSGGNSYLGGGGNDTYIISPYTLSGSITAKIVDTEGANVIQLVDGLTIASSSFFNNAVQLVLSNGAIVQILGAASFSYQVGADATAGDTSTGQTYSQFANTLGASVPLPGAASASGTVNFVVPSSSVPAVATYAIAAGAVSCDEGSTAIFTVTTTNVANGTVLNYTLSGTGITTADITGGALTGSVTVNNNIGTISVPLVADVTTEGNETLSVTVNGKTASTTIVDTSVATTVATYAIAEGAASYDEGSTASFTVTTTNVANGTVLNYTLSGTGITAADITGGALTGTVPINNNIGTISVPLAADGTTEGNETLSVTVNGKTASTTIVDIGVPVVATYAIKEGAASYNEGSMAIFTITTTNVVNGTVLNYTLSGTGITAADITGGALSGTVPINNNIVPRIDKPS